MEISLTWHWWYTAIAFFLIPLIYASGRSSGGPYDMMVDVLVLMCVCWSVTGTLVASHFLAWIFK